MRAVSQKSKRVSESKTDFSFHIVERRMEVAQFISSYATALHPCALEPINIEGNEYLCCGCYELKEDEQARVGSIELWKVSTDNDSHSIERCLSSQFSGGILDLKIDREFLLCALSSEEMVVQQVLLSDGELALVKVMGYCKEGEGLFLCVDYNRTFQCIGGSILMSTQSSSIIITTMTEIGLEETGHKQSVHCLLGQPMPIWTVAIDKCYDTNKFISGGDDCTMRLWDLRVDSCVGANSRQHTAGVTAAQWHPGHEHIFLTGSYDETCCIWDMRNIKSPLHVVQTGGGAWRAKWCTLQRNDMCILTTAMQAGCSVHRLQYIETETAEMKIDSLSSHMFSNDSPKQLIYDLCVLPSTCREPSPLLACCSFYDSTLHMCKISS